MQLASSKVVEDSRLTGHTNQLSRFSLYEEYGAKYESMLRNMAMLSKIIPNWSTYERGIEALVNSFFPQSGVLEGNKKGLTHEDLLIKVKETVSFQDSELIFTIISLYKESANIHCYSRSSTNIRQWPTVNSLAKRSKRFCFVFVRQPKRSTRPPMTSRRRSKSRDYGTYKIFWCYQIM